LLKTFEIEREIEQRGVREAFALIAKSKSGKVPWDLLGCILFVELQ
jgi:hypothetical protein